VATIGGVIAIKPISAQARNNLRGIQCNSSMLGEKVKYQSLDNRERELEEFAVMDEQRRRYFLAGGTTALREAVNDLKTRPVVLKLVRFREQEIDGFQKNRRTADPDVSRPALLNLYYKMRVPMCR
jgi:hypothetical protein